jgi:hypothetical protein
MSVVHNLQNDTRLNDFEALVDELAEDEASGEDALANLAIAFSRAVADKVIDIAKDKNGDDAAVRYFKRYAARKGKKAYHNRTEGSAKAQSSKLRQFQNAADNPKFDWIDVLNRGIIIRQQAIKDSIAVKSAFPAYTDLAREQLKLDDEMDDAMIYEVIIKGDNTKEVTVEGQLKKAHKILEELVTGENKHGLKDQSPETIIAQEQLAARLTTLLMTKQASEAAVALAEAEAYLQK